MAKIPRAILKLFGSSGDVSNFGEFGSQAASAPVKTKDIPTIQSLSAWLNGLQDSVNASNHAPFLEDMNSLFYVLCYQLFYLFQQGLPEWDASVTYYTGSLVLKPGTNQIYQSLTDDNINNALPSATDSINWQFIFPVRFSTLLGSIALGQIPDSLITSAKIISLAATKITGLIDQSQIGSVAAAAVSGILGIGSGGTGQNIKMIDFIQWAGDGNNNRLISSSIGVAPDIAFAWQIGGPSSVVVRVTSNGTNNSQLVTGGARTDCIRDFSDAGIIIGTGSPVNAIGSNYAALLIKHQFGS